MRGRHARSVSTKPHHASARAVYLPANAQGRSEDDGDRVIAGKSCHLATDGDVYSLVLGRELPKLFSTANWIHIRGLIVSKRITREPRDYQKAGVTAIVAQQLFGRGVKLRPGQTVEYVITDSDSAVPNDRVRAFALWEGWFGYDRKKYTAMLREAFEPFVLCLPKTPEENLFTDSLTEEELKMFHLFTPLALLRLLKV